MEEEKKEHTYDRELKDILLIDGDILLYRAANACDVYKNWDDVAEYIWKQMSDIAEELGTWDYIGLLQGYTNFRKEVSTQAVYKGNRKSSKPFWFHAVKEHFKVAYGFTVVEGMETDDALTILHKRLGDKSIIVSIDKDLMQSPGKHYRLATKGREPEISVVKEEFGLKMLAVQVLMGDTTDNIPGLAGIGEAKAEKALMLSAPDLVLEDAIHYYLAYYRVQQEKGKIDVTPAELVLMAVKHYAETLELVFLRRDMEEYETPIIENLSLITPNEHGPREKEEQSTDEDPFN
jgi:hypothetical protein